MTQPRHIHLIGICGTAMASLAGMLQQRGLRVTGSDAAVYPPMSDFLASRGIHVSQPFSERNLEPQPDWVVVGNAISRGNVELEHVLDLGIAMRSLPQVLEELFLEGRENLVIAGTHGKTTTASMLAWIFQTAGLAPSFLIGGIVENFGSSFALTESKHFILEGDEYDTAFFDKGPKFLHYRPSSLLLTHVEFDHADIYPDLESVKTAFKRLVNLAPRRGRIVAYDASANLDECLRKAYAPVERYGFAERSEWRAVDLRFQSERTSWTLLHEGKPWAELSYSIAGEHNVLNATGAAALAASCGIKPEAVVRALATYKSVKRRLEVIAEVNGITVIDDFAHHPTAIAATLDALRTRYPGRRLWAVFEPRSNAVRRKVFARELRESLGRADAVVIAGIFRPENVPEQDRLDPTTLVAGLEKAGKPARYLSDADAIVSAIAPELRPGDVVALLSNGGFGGIYQKLPERLKSLSEVHA